MNRVAAVVINRDTREFLSECLESIASQDFAGGISVWVVDNGSSDGSPQMVLADFPDVNLVWNRRNAGYARACNQGMDRTDEPYVLLLNSDTVLSPDTVAGVVEFFERNPRCGVVGPRVLDPDGTVQCSCRKFPSLKEAFFHAFLGLFNADNPYSFEYRKKGWNHSTEAQVDWVSGASMALRREALREVGGFDEKYFMYVEDVDLCWRMWQAGWTVGYIPRGDVMHYVGQSSRAVSTRMLFHHHRSMLRFHTRTYRGPLRLPANIVVALGVTARFFLIVTLNFFYRVRAALGGAGRTIMPGRQ